MANWYALYTKPHREQQVHDLLCDRGIEVFLPQMRAFHKGRVMQTRQPLFPCYLFAHFDTRQTGLYPVQWTQGLRTVVSFCGEPGIVDDEIIAYVKNRIAGEVGPAPASRFKVGDAVRINEGPFKDLAAVFDGTLTGSGRVRVLLKVLGQQAHVDVNEAWLEALA